MYIICWADSTYEISSLIFKKKKKKKRSEKKNNRMSSCVNYPKFNNVGNGNMLTAKLLILSAADNILIFAKSYFL